MSDTLYSRTEANHKACMAHPLGQSMVRGEITASEWADWLWAFRVLHMVADREVPRHMHRDALLGHDLSQLPPATPSPAALEFASHLAAAESAVGAAYVLHGAHRSGGRQIASLMSENGLPTSHILYADQKRAQDWVRETRKKVEYAHQANATFAALLRVMEEITSRHAPEVPVEG